MLLTQKEAREKYCPMSMVIDRSEYNPSEKIMEQVSGPANCYGEFCMAWTWIGEKGYCRMVEKP